MSKTEERTVEPEGKPTMARRRTLLSLIAAALAAAALIACSGAGPMPAAPDEERQTVTEKTGTAPPTETAETEVEEPQKASAPGQGSTAVHGGKTGTPQPSSVIKTSPAKARANAAGSTSAGTVSIEDIMENGLDNVGASPVHLAVRGTPVDGSARCQWRGIARTKDQRDDTVRMMIGLEPDEEMAHAEYLSVLFEVTVDTIQPDLPTVLKSNFESIARGGLSEEFQFLTCFADYSVTEYLLGTGPATITVAHDNLAESPSYALYSKAHAAGDYGTEALRTEEQHQDGMDVEAEETARINLPTGEEVVFLAPMGAHNAIAFEAWQSIAQWPTETDEEGTLHITRPELPEFEDDHEITLQDLRTRITAAASTDSFADDRVANASEPDTVLPGHRRLRRHHTRRRLGRDLHARNAARQWAYVKAQPPPETNEGLVSDCNALLQAKDMLEGTSEPELVQGS